MSRQVNISFCNNETKNYRFKNGFIIDKYCLKRVMDLSNPTISQLCHVFVQKTFGHG